LENSQDGKPQEVCEGGCCEEPVSAEGGRHLLAREKKGDIGLGRGEARPSAWKGSGAKDWGRKTPKRNAASEEKKDLGGKKTLNSVDGEGKIKKEVVLKS